MATKVIASETRFLERCRVALTNAENHEEIKPLLAEFGMNADKIIEGRTLLEETKKVWDHNVKEDAETKIASNDYKAAYTEMRAIFKEHRDKTRTFFYKEPEVLITLGVTGAFPASYTVFFEKIKQFYMGIQNNPEIQTKMNLIKITPEIVSEGLAKYNHLLAERANYEKELGESQDATKSKDAALLTLLEWMDDFDAIAKVALYNKPQLLEVLGIFVRS